MAGRTMKLRDANGEYTIMRDEGRVTVRVTVNGGQPVPTCPGADGTVRVGAHPARTAWTAIAGDVRWVFLDGQVHTFEAVQANARRRTGGHHGTLAAPMPATVIRIEAAAGDRVARGAVLIVLEAMKMELPIRAALDGVVSAINCSVGDLVQPGVGLIEIDEISS